jgi:hypothetical protein
MTLRFAVLLGVPGIALMIAALPWLPGPQVVAYAALFIGSSALFLATAPAILRASLSRRQLASLLALLFLVRAGFLFTTPIGSDDFHRYLWDGRVQAAGLNPYRHAPGDPELQPLHTATLPHLVNHPTLKTPYFPLAEWTFRLAHGLSRESVWGIKVLVLLAEVLAVAGLCLLLKQLGRPPGHVLLYAAAPLTIVQFAVDAHVDAIGFPFLVFGLLLHLRGRKGIGLLLLGLSMSVKPVAAVVLPFLFLRERGWRARLAVPLVPLLVIVVQFVPYLGDAGVFDGLFRFARNWTFNGAFFSVVHAAIGDNQRARLVCAALFAIALLVVGVRSREVTATSVHAVLLLLLFSPVVHPWYVGWLAVLTPIAPRPSSLALVGTVSLTSLTVVTYQLDGVWVDYGLVRAAEYLPVVALLAWEAFPRRGCLAARGS